MPDGLEFIGNAQKNILGGGFEAIDRGDISGELVQVTT